MPRRRIRLTGAPEAPLRAALTALRAGLGVPEDFPPEVREEATRAAKNPPPAHDASELPFFTLEDPLHPGLTPRRGLGVARCRSARP
ncbi:hypothetical protein ACIRUL_04660 [Streptomyces sp. NPDC101171]|uniref:hypothetical protein n=1 Tax=Streptomyces sp. NPDC101171 TaxID=3366122 RepID=UPI00382E9B42